MTRVFYLKAVGNQSDRPIRIPPELGDIDLTNPGEDRWIYTLVQTVDPTNNPVSMKTKWLHLIEQRHYQELETKFNTALDIIESLYKRHLWHPDMGECICDPHSQAAEFLSTVRGNK